MGSLAFEIALLTQHDRARVAEVVDPAAAEAHGLKPALAMDAHGDLLVGPGGRYCPCLQTVIGRSRRFCGHASD